MMLGTGAAIAVAVAVMLGAGSASARERRRDTGRLAMPIVAPWSASAPAAPAVQVTTPPAATIAPPAAIAPSASIGPQAAIAAPATAPVAATPAVNRSTTPAPAVPQTRVPETNACRGNARSVTHHQERRTCALISIGVGHKVG